MQFSFTSSESLFHKVGATVEKEWAKWKILRKMSSTPPYVGEQLEGGSQKPVIGIQGHRRRDSPPDTGHEELFKP